jgi:hypothetical protein
MARRILWILIALFGGAALLFFVLDALAYSMSGDWKSAPLGQRWFEFHKDSLLLIQPAIERHLSPALWPPIAWTLTQAAWAAALVPAILLWLLDQIWLKRRGRRAATDRPS